MQVPCVPAVVQAVPAAMLLFPVGNVIAPKVLEFVVSVSVMVPVGWLAGLTQDRTVPKVADCAVL